MNVRRLNDKGLQEFSLFIENLGAGSALDIPLHLLESASHSDAIADAIVVDSKPFATRYEMGVYLAGCLKGIDMQPYLGDAGFWSWFALLWFDQLCPKDKDGKLKPARGDNYVLSHRHNHRLRHAVYTTWQLVNRYGDDAQLLLCKGMSTRGEITEQLMAKPDLLTSAGVIRLASELYFDPANRAFKKGAASRTGTGNIGRYVIWLQQLQVTFDIFTMSKEDLIAVLPAEFGKFRTQAEAKPAA